MTYSQVGWINVIILGILVTPYLLNYLNRKIFKTRNKVYFKILRLFRKLHKPLGIMVLVLGVIHGYLALGGLRFHTGSLLYLSIFITSALGGSFHRLKKRHLLTWHRGMAFITSVLFLLHLFYPSAIYYLLGI